MTSTWSRALYKCRQMSTLPKDAGPLVSFRDATKDDKTAVLSLRANVYRGLDYLPDYFDYFIADPNRRCIVGHIDGEMVAFGVMLIMDNGQSVLGQAGRVKESHEGRGIFRSLTTYINNIAKSAGCKRRIALVETTLNKYARSERFRRAHREIDSKLHYAGLITEDQRRVFHNSRSRPNDVKAVIGENLINLVTSEHYKHYLFPRDTLLLDYVPLKGISENIDLFKGRDNKFFSTIKRTGGDVTGLLSAGSSFTCINPPKSYTIDIFGHQVDDVELHLHYHVIRACNMFPEGSFCLQIFVEKGYIAQKLCSILLKYGVPKCNWYVEGGVATKTVVEEVLE